MNGRETLEHAASTPPRRNERPWEVSFASGKTSRRVSRARVVVPARYFRPKSLKGPIVAYVAARRNASETAEYRLSMTSITLDQSSTPSP
jgi:hypothetical protein